VLTPALASQLRGWLVDTTVRGTARRAFRVRGGRPLLPGIAVAGKTGSLNGTDPKGHYEWFIGVAPADDPKIAIATVAVQGKRWWWSASQLAAEVLRAAFCPDGRCSPQAVDRLTAPLDAEPPTPSAPPPPQVAQPATAG
jgi:cell division protein FtsI/penicillin-binding protein 2